MKFSNFRLLKKNGRRFNAMLTVSKWFGLLTYDVSIHKKGEGHWEYKETGKYTPGFEIEDLQRAFCARHGKDLEHIQTESELKIKDND